MRRNLLLQRLRRLQFDIHGILGNKLCLAKVCLSLIGTGKRKPKASRIQDSMDAIDDAIKRVDAEINVLINEIESESGIKKEIGRGKEIP